MPKLPKNVQKAKAATTRKLPVLSPMERQLKELGNRLIFLQARSNVIRHKIDQLSQEMHEVVTAISKTREEYAALEREMNEDAK